MTIIDMKKNCTSSRSSTLAIGTVRVIMIIKIIMATMIILMRLMMVMMMTLLSKILISHLIKEFDPFNRHSEDDNYDDNDNCFDLAPHQGARPLPSALSTEELQQQCQLQPA